MSVQLKIDEMLEVLLGQATGEPDEKRHPLAARFQADVERLANQMAVEVAAMFGVEAGEATFQGVAFAGTCAPFLPTYRDQPCPAPLAAMDNESEWDATDPDLPAFRPGFEPVDGELDTLDGRDVRRAIQWLESLASAEADEIAGGLRAQYCISCGRISEDCSEDPCEAVEAERDEGDSED